MAGIQDYMTNPWGAAALALSIPLVLSHMLRLRPRVLPVPSLRFWRGEVSEPYVNRPWQPIRDRKSLLLQLLALLLACGALMGLQVPGKRAPAESTLWFLDLSASMQALTPSGKSRYKLATEHIRNRLDAASAHDRFGLVTFARDITVVVAPGGTADAVAEALDGLRPAFVADQPGIWNDELFQHWLVTREMMPTELLTGPLTQEALDRISSGIGVVTFGSPVANRGVVHTEVVPVWKPGEFQPQWELHASSATHAQGAGKDGVSGAPSSMSEGEPLRLERLDRISGTFSAANAARPTGGFTVFQLGGGEAAGIWRVGFANPDGFPADDRVVVRVNPPPAFTVRVEASGDALHRPELLGPARPTGTEADPVPSLTRMLWTLGARTDGALALKGGILIPDPADAVSGDGSDGAVNPQNLTYQHHAWFEGLALEAIPLAESVPLPEAGGYTPLLTHGGRPVCAVRVRPDGSTDLAMSPSLLDNRVFTASDTFVTIMSRWHQSNLAAAGVLTSGPVGEFASGGQPATLSPHVLSSQETRQVSEGVRLVRRGAQTESQQQFGAWPLAPWLAGLAVVVVLLEWMRYVRRFRAGRTQP